MPHEQAEYMAAPDQLAERQILLASRAPSIHGHYPPGRNGERNFHGEKRTNDTHASRTDPDARLYRKSSNTAANPSARRQCPLKKRIKENRSQPRFYASSSGCLKIPGSSRSPLELSGLACR